MKPTWDGVTPYDFYTNATYVCDSDDVFFEHDLLQESFTVMCTDSGRWNTPPVWPRCVESKQNKTIPIPSIRPQFFLILLVFPAVHCPAPPPMPYGGTWQFDDFTNNTFGKKAK